MIINVLLSTYNGAEYLPRFLDSLCAQTFKDFTLVIRDDGSSDSSLNIVQSYFDKLTISIIKSNCNLGWRESFRRLIDAADADVVIFADQDDVWDNSKVGSIVEFYNGIELNAGVLLVHFANTIDSESEYIDHDISLGDPMLYKKSFFGFRGGYHGCCCALNKVILNKLKSLDSSFFISGHDFLFSILSKYFFGVHYIQSSLIDWRVHAGNSSSVKFGLYRKLIFHITNSYKNTIVQLKIIKLFHYKNFFKKILLFFYLFITYFIPR